MIPLLRSCSSLTPNLQRLVYAAVVVVIYGAIAQLVEHLHGMQGVRSSSLLGSINFDQPRKVTWEIIGRVSIYVSI